LKKLRKFVTVAKLKSLALLGPLRADRMLEFGADYQKMNVVHLSVVQREIALAKWKAKILFN
jgi:predicted Ser/Thr protein kinase